MANLKIGKICIYNLKMAKLKIFHALNRLSFRQVLKLLKLNHYMLQETCIGPFHQEFLCSSLTRFLRYSKFISIDFGSFLTVSLIFNRCIFFVQQTLHACISSSTKAFRIFYLQIESAFIFEYRKIF